MAVDNSFFGLLKELQDNQYKLMTCSVNNPLWMQEKVLQDRLHSIFSSRKSIGLDDTIGIEINLGMFFQLVATIQKRQNFIWKNYG